MLPNVRTTRNEVATPAREIEALVVARGRAVAKPLVEFLRTEGINVQVSASPENVFEEVLLHRPNVVLIEEGISAAGGIDVCEALKSHPRTHFIPVILFSGGREAQRLAATVAGADAVFSPSVGLEERRARLWALLRSEALLRRQEKQRHSQTAAIQTRRRWVRSLAHDLQNAMGAVQANFEFLAQEAVAKGPIAPDTQECIQDSRALFQELSRGLRTVLAFERFESEAVTLREKAVSMGDLAQSTRDTLAWIASSSGKSVTVEEAPGTPPICGDADYLREALANLVAFVLRQANNRQCRIQISNSRGLCQVRVVGDQDRLPSEWRARIFEPYAAIGQQQAMVGHGLGLALAQVIVEVHGGRIWVEDVPRAGSAFVMELPSGGPAPLTPSAE
jgi:signal transduction histidine kinase